MILRRALSLMAILLVLFLSVPGTAWAEDEAAKDALSMDELAEIMEASPSYIWIIATTRILPILLGIAFLIAIYLRHDKVVAGQVPPPPPSPPSPFFTPGIAVLMALLAMLGAPLVVGMVYAAATGLRTPTTMDGVLIMMYSAPLVAAYLLWQRARTRRAPFPAFPKAVGIGLRTFCIASVFVTPLILLTTLLMGLFGSEPQAQELVREVIDSGDGGGDASLPWLITIYGVLAAPLIEEIAFRGLLYPALKSLFGGTKRAAIGSAVVVSLLFAAVHGSLTMFAGLFALAMVLTWVYERTNSLAAIVIAHATNNLLSLIPLLLLKYGA